MGKFKSTYDKNEVSEFIEEKGKKEFEESFEETKDSTPSNKAIKKTRSYENLHVEKKDPSKFQKKKNEKEEKQNEVNYYMK